MEMKDFQNKGVRQTQLEKEKGLKVCGNQKQETLYAVSDSIEREVNKMMLDIKNSEK